MDDIVQTWEVMQSPRVMCSFKSTSEYVSLLIGWVLYN